jgi:histone acetyltransferase (RNA polymerase elongator complex component)
LIKEYGITLGLQMMVGLPGDNAEKDLYTAKEIIKLCPDFVRIYPALVIKDTYMEFMYKNNLFNPLTVDEAVEICKKLYIIFTKHNINIIRIGLQATEEINVGKDIVAGPFHPSFRELVEASILNNMMGYIIKNNFNDSEKIIIEISNRDISKLYAGKKKFFINKINEHPTKNITIQQSADVQEELYYSEMTKNKLLCR